MSCRASSARSRPAPWTALLAATALLWGCTGAAPTIRQHTYPPDFRYIEQAELRSTMWQLAALVKEIDQTMVRRETDPEGARTRIHRLLSEMERVSGQLGSGGWPSNHPRVSRNLERFRGDVAAARRALEAEPPGFYRAGVVSGACLHCHGDE